MEQRIGSSTNDLLETPVKGGKNLSSEQRRSLDLSKKIPGWGVDLDPKVRPGYPRDQARLIGPDVLYPNFEQQVPPFTIFKSTEHAKLTPVFGTSCPPSGLSGLIRAQAYKLSEGRVWHWLLLAGADRVDVVEGLLEDFMSLRIPNVPKEMGLKAEWKYNRSGVIKKVLGLGAAVASVIVVSKYLDDRRKNQPRFDYPTAGDSRADD